MNNNRISILNMGMVTSVGMNAEQTAASVRAGLTSFEETSIYNKRFEPFVMALLPDEALPPLHPEIDKMIGLTSRQIRMLRLATPAIQETLKDFSTTSDIPLYLGLAETLPERDDAVKDDFIDLLAKQSGIELNTPESKLFMKGRAAGLIALESALNQLQIGKVSKILVSGLDTYLDLYLLGMMDMENRILGGEVMDGFIPGEGAGFLLLTKESVVNSVSIKAVSSGFEKGHMYSEETYKGDGLAETVQKLFQTNDKMDPIQDVYSSMNGENHWAKEWGVAFMRNQNNFTPEHGMHHPADCYGDVGAASGPLMIGMAATGMKKAYNKSPILITCSSDFGNRAAVIIEK